MQVGARALETGIWGAWQNVLINMPDIEDEAFNYKTAGDLVETVGRLSPNGIDVYYENVGGRHLEAALQHMNTYGRLVMCGMIDQYNVTEPPAGPTNLGYVISKQLKMQGFIVIDYMDRMPLSCAQFFI